MALSSRHFRKASLCKQTAYYNSICARRPKPSQQYPPGAQFALLFSFSLNSSTILKHAGPTSAHSKSLNPNLSSDKKMPSLFFSFGGSEALFKRCLVAFTTVQFKGSSTFFNVQLHLETLDRSVLSFSKDRRRKGRFLTTDAHYVGCGLAK